MRIPSVFRSGLLASLAVVGLACAHESKEPAFSPPEPTSTTKTTSASVSSRADSAPTQQELNDAALRRSTTDVPNTPNALDSSALGGPATVPAPGSATGDTNGPASAMQQANDMLTKAEPRLTDGQILQVVIGANQGEINMADFAIRNAKSDDVKQFAAMMKSHHTSGLQKAKSTETKTKIVPASSDLSNFLDKEVADVDKDLHKKSGIDFDRAYMDAQVQAHRDVLAALDHRMIPNATHSELKSLLAETRKVVVSHLTKAEGIDGKLLPTSSGPMSIQGQHPAPGKIAGAAR
jgi:putative membrane protein